MNRVLNKKVATSIIAFVAFILSLYSLVSPYFKVPNLYDKSANTVIESQNINYIFSSVKIVTDDTDVRYKWNLLHGKEEPIEINSKDNISIKVDKSFGKLRVLAIKDGDNTVAGDQKIEVKNSNMDLEPGKYMIYLIGKNFIGNISYSEK